MFLRENSRRKYFEKIFCKKMFLRDSNDGNIYPPLFWHFYFKPKNPKQHDVYYVKYKQSQRLLRTYTFPT